MGVFPTEAGGSLPVRPSDSEPKLPKRRPPIFPETHVDVGEFGIASSRGSFGDATTIEGSGDTGADPACPTGGVPGDSDEDEYAREPLG